MKSAVKSATLCVVLATGMVSCGGDGATPRAMNPNPVEFKRDPEAASSRTPAAGPRTAGPAAGPAPVQTIPRGAQYTIFCQTFTGATHIAESKAAKDMLARESGLPDFHVIIKEGRSDLCYGYYREVVPERNPIEADRVATDKKRLLALTRNGLPLFGGVTAVALALPDPEAPPEWNVVNTKGYWSVVIAGYTDPVSRKGDAVESVRVAREMGVDAYYFHGENVSNVCIGSFPRQAVREQQATKAQTFREDQPLIVSTARIMPDERAMMENAHPDAKIVAPEIIVDDKAMLTVMRTYPEYTLDGYVDTITMTDKKTGQKVVKPKRSFLVEIPQAQRTVLSGSDRPRAEEPTPTLLNPVRRNDGGTLRGLDATGTR